MSTTAVDSCLGCGTSLSKGVYRYFVCVATRHVLPIRREFIFKRNSLVIDEAIIKRVRALEAFQAIREKLL